MNRFISCLCVALLCHNAFGGTNTTQTNTVINITSEYVDGLIQKIKDVINAVKNVKQISNDTKKEIEELVEVQYIAKKTKLQQSEVVERIVSLLQSGVLDVVFSKDAKITCKDIKEKKVVTTVCLNVDGVGDCCKFCELEIKKSTGKIRDIALKDSNNAFLTSMSGVITTLETSNAQW